MLNLPPCLPLHARVAAAGPERRLWAKRLAVTVTYLPYSNKTHPTFAGHQRKKTGGNPAAAEPSPDAGRFP